MRRNCRQISKDSNVIGKRSPVLITILLFILVIAPGQYVQAVPAKADPPQSSGSAGGVDLWYLHSQNFRKAALVMDNPYNNPLIAVGIQMTYNASEGTDYKARVIIQRGTLEGNNEARMEAEIEGFRTGNGITQNFLFNQDECVILDGDYNLQLKPLGADHLTLQYTEDVVGHSYFWDPTTDEWVQNGDSPGVPNMEEREWMMGALVEPVSPLVVGITRSESMTAPDALDAFYADMVMGRTYVLGLEHSDSRNFQIYLYGDRGAGGVGGLLDESTLLASSSDDDAQKHIAFTSEYSGRYYVVVRPKTGSGAYELSLRENRPPVAEAGDDVCANLEMGGSVSVSFRDGLSFDPDDDKNDNGMIEPPESNNLFYYWDFDSTVDSNGDGDPLNDRDAVGRQVEKRYTEGGKRTVILTVEDPYGSCDSDTLDLFINYVPVVKMNIEFSEDGNAYTDRRLLFSAEGSYDPDDDCNHNGIIDGDEIDNLTYYWDFFDGKDRDYDGNSTNDTDATNPMWLMRYDDPGQYVITLNVVDDPESGTHAVNSTRRQIEIIEYFDPTELFPAECTEDGLLRHVDENQVPGMNEAMVDDVVIRTRQAGREEVIEVGNETSQNLRECYARGEGGRLIIGIEAMGEIEMSDECAYHLHIVDHKYTEPEFSPSAMDNIRIDSIYSFTIRNTKISMSSYLDEIDMNEVHFTMMKNGAVLEVSIPFTQLTGLRELANEDDEFLLDIFAVVEKNVTTIIKGERAEIYCRDSVGRNIWVLTTENDDTKKTENRNKTVGLHLELIFFSVLTGAASIAILTVIVLKVSRKRNRKEYREYIIAKPVNSSRGFTVGSDPSSGNGAISSYSNSDYRTDRTFIYHQCHIGQGPLTHRGR